MYITTIQQHVNAGDSQSIAKDGIYPDINCAPDTTDNVSSDDATPGVVYRTDDEILYSPTVIGSRESNVWSRFGLRIYGVGFL